MIIYAVFCILLAYVNYRVIKKGLRVYHAINGGLHIVAAVLLWHFADIQTALAGLFMAKTVFDTSLNILRFGWSGFDYISKSPKAIMDKIERFFFKGDYLTAKLTYILIMVCLLTIK
jgi:hypothetical protein